MEIDHCTIGLVSLASQERDIPLNRDPYVLEDLEIRCIRSATTRGILGEQSIEVDRENLDHLLQTVPFFPPITNFKRELP